MCISEDIIRYLINFNIIMTVFYISLKFKISLFN